MSRQIARTLDIRLLLAIPVLTYLASYFYLAYYHGNLFLFNTVVHEGGTHTLLQTIFYASHFIGHVPIIAAVALLFAGALVSFADVKNIPRPPKTHAWILLILAVSLLVLSFILSMIICGREDTMSFILQKKQAVDIYEEGGAWNLHLPSTLLLFFMIPPYVFIFKLIFGISIHPGRKGIIYFIAAFLFTLFFTFIVNADVLGSLKYILQNPRYLAHSVRELMTFPLTYFPIPLYFILKMEKNLPQSPAPSNKNYTKYIIAACIIIFIVGLSYQSYVSLSAGISNMAQKPEFAKQGSLGIPYLLASHYFEHFLDTILFTLITIMFFHYRLPLKYPDKHST